MTYCPSYNDHEATARLWQAISALVIAGWACPAGAQAADLLAALPPRLASCATSASPVPDGGWERQSVYVPMADGVRIAVDIWRPAGLDGGIRLPAILVATRYGRSRAGGDPSAEYRNWISRGFAVVVMDVRGTGASFGRWYIPYTRQEAEDVGRLAKWIVVQPWSNGRVATTGTSYPGTTALTAPAFGAPAVVASVARFSDFDMYADLLFPGGAVAENLIVTWGKWVRTLDLNQESPGVRPVDGPDGNRLLAAAVAEHRKVDWSFDKAAEDVTFRDGPLRRFAGMRIDEAGAFNLQQRIEASRVPIFGWASWMDSGTAQGILSRFATWRNPQVSIIGAWGHGARHDADPFHIADRQVDVSRALQEQLNACFVSPYVSGGTSPSERALIYYTMGEDRWKSTSVWPVRGTKARRYYLEAGGGLGDRRPATVGRDRYAIDFTASTGASNRWSTQVDGSDVVYGNRREADRQLLTYTSTPLDADMEVTGSGVVTFRLASSHSDGTIFVYLEDVAPDGRVTYVTEGQFRMLHRKLSGRRVPYSTTYPQHSFFQADAAPMVPGQFAELTFQLLPTSVLFRAGHRIRVAISGADAGNFRRNPLNADSDVSWTIAHGGKEASFLELPVVPR